MRSVLEGGEGAGAVQDLSHGACVFECCGCFVDGAAEFGPLVEDSLAQRAEAGLLQGSVRDVAVEGGELGGREALALLLVAQEADVGVELADRGVELAQVSGQELVALTQLDQCGHLHTQRRQRLQQCLLMSGLVPKRGRLDEVLLQLVLAPHANSGVKRQTQQCCQRSDSQFVDVHGSPIPSGPYCGFVDYITILRNYKVCLAKNACSR